MLSFAASRNGGGGSSDQRSRDATARALAVPAGQWLVGAAGTAVIVTGGRIAVRAVLRKYHDELRLGRMSRRIRRLVDVTGVVGGAARGLVLAVAGVFAVRAAVDYEPERAKGLDDTLRTFTDTPLGPLAADLRRGRAGAVRGVLLRHGPLAARLSRAWWGTRSG